MIDAVRHLPKLVWCLLALLVLVAVPRRALAHDGPLPTPETVWRVWNWDPLIVFGLIMTSALYARGVGSLWRRAGIGRGVRRWQAAAFAGGVLTLFIALISPVDGLGVALFAGHMIQHLLLIVIAAPLLVLGMPLIAWVWALPPAWRRGVGRWWQRQTILRRVWKIVVLPPVAWLLHALAILIWHIPFMYEIALRYEWAHALEHGSFLGTALLFWWAIVHPGAHGRLGYGASILYLFLTATQGVILGALITFASTPLYDSHVVGAVLWGLTPLEDQQLAGLLMWVPPSVIYLLAVGVLFVAWFGALEGTMRQREQRWTHQPEEKEKYERQHGIV